MSAVLYFAANSVVFALPFVAFFVVGFAPYGVWFVLERMRRRRAAMIALALFAAMNLFSGIAMTLAMARAIA